MNRFLGGLTKSVRKPWHIYPIGVLFGLGFDTATEVGLLVLAGGAAAFNLPFYAILVLPILFAAGMCLMDTVDGVFMNAAYGWAFAKPVRKVFYNITITSDLGRRRADHRHHRAGRRPRRPGPHHHRPDRLRSPTSRSTTPATPSSGCSSCPGSSRWRSGGSAASSRSGRPTSPTDRPPSRLAPDGGPQGRASFSALRELIPSLVNTLRRCHSTVRGLMKRRAPISGLDRPSRARPAICCS